MATYQSMSSYMEIHNIEFYIAALKPQISMIEINQRLVNRKVVQCNLSTDFVADSNS